MRPLFRPILYCLLAYILFFAGLGAVGFVGPDEPRYADVAREMIRSGDYITPRLFGSPWFEKPPLYYWLAALFFRLGVNEVTARLPSALAAAGFLGLWFWFAKRFYGERAAHFSCLLLATTAGWIGFARAAAMDMLLSTALGAALIFLAVWFWEKKPAALYGFYALLGVATLAKGPLAVALAGLIAFATLAHFREWTAIPKLLWTPAVACFAIIALPWYWLCYSRNGFVFVEEFFIRHNLQRLTSAAIGHAQPFWFYVPIIATALFPWTPLLLLPLLDLARVGWRRTRENPQKAFLFYWIVLPFAFFSLAENKLPGYLLPVLPPLTLWIACAMDVTDISGKEQPYSESSGMERVPAKLVGLSAWLLLAIPPIGLLLPEALATGLRHALAEMPAASLWGQVWKGPVPVLIWLVLAGLVVVSLFLLWRKQTLGAAVVVVFGVAWALLAITHYLSPAINRVASARNVARRVESLGIPPQELAAFYIHRNQVFGLGFYLAHSLPEWSPEAVSQEVSFVAARQDIRVDEIKPGARSLTLFPGQRLRLWALAPPP